MTGDEGSQTSSVMEDSRMSGVPLEADYLVIGAGVMGMAFTDVLMTETESISYTNWRPLSKMSP